jgi:hypothetical protein
MQPLLRCENAARPPAAYQSRTRQDKELSRTRKRTPAPKRDEESRLKKLKQNSSAKRNTRAKRTAEDRVEFCAGCQSARAAVQRAEVQKNRKKNLGRASNAQPSHDTTAEREGVSYVLQRLLAKNSPAQSRLRDQLETARSDNKLCSPHDDTKDGTCVHFGAHPPAPHDGTPHDDLFQSIVDSVTEHGVPLDNSVVRAFHARASEVGDLSAALRSQPQPPPEPSPLHIYVATTAELDATGKQASISEFVSYYSATRALLGSTR